MTTYNFNIYNLTHNTISLDSEKVRESLGPLRSLTVDPKDFIGNYDLCTQLSTFVNNSKVQVKRGSTVVTYSDLLSYAQGSDMLKVEYDVDDDIVVDSSSGGGSASEIVYDNSGSGIASEDIQGAIDEVLSTSLSYTDSEVVGIRPTTILSKTSIDLIDATDFTIVEATPSMTLGHGVKLTVTPSTATGQLTIELYQDSGRSEKVFEHVVDLSDSTTYYSFEVFGFSNETAGTLYGTFLCSGIPASQTADISLYCDVMQPIASGSDLSDTYGDGLENDGLGNPQVKLATSSGLGFDVDGSLKLSPDLTADSYPSSTSGGAFLVGTVNTSGDQDITGIKRFSSVGCVPTGSSGSPSTGTYTAGSEIIDSDNIKWRCLTGGSPGTWELVDVVTEQTTVLNTSALGNGASEILEIPVKGNVGSCFWIRIWGRTSTGTALQQIPYRSRIYQTSSANGRELVWQGNGLMRQTTLSAELPASQSYMEVSSNDIIDVDEAVVIYEDNTRYEFARISGRPSGQMTLDEALIDISSWASGTLILAVDEFFNVPWYNTDGNPSNSNKIFLEIKHDALVTDPDLVFYVETLAQSRGLVR